MLYYLGGYVFTALAAFVVATVTLRHTENEEISDLAGLHRRAPFLAAAMTLALASLAGVPPLAGFFGKFLLFRAAVAQGLSDPAYLFLVAIAIAGVVVSFYYYFAVVRVMYWAPDPGNGAAVAISLPAKIALWLCVAGMLSLGLYPGPLLASADAAVRGLGP
jgi:NADH-quinone oxidoreductase subunit N